MSQHLLFAAGLVLCAVSTGFWLVLHAAFQSNIDAERQARIDQFIADPTSPVPESVVAVAPDWLVGWKWLNCALFLMLFLADALPLFGVLPMN